MNRLLLVIPCFFILTGCLPDDEQKATMCYDVIPINNMPPGSPVLINKCTGESWSVVRQPNEEWVWKKMQKEYSGDPEQVKAALKAKYGLQ